jgi:hypothetical protein
VTAGFGQPRRRTPSCLLAALRAESDRPCGASIAPLRSDQNHERRRRPHLLPPRSGARAGRSHPRGSAWRGRTSERPRRRRPIIGRQVNPRTGGRQARCDSPQPVSLSAAVHKYELRRAARQQQQLNCENDAKYQFFALSREGASLRPTKLSLRRQKRHRPNPVGDGWATSTLPIRRRSSLRPAA